MTNWKCAYLGLAQPTRYIELKIYGICPEVLRTRIEFARNDSVSYHGHTSKNEDISLYGITQKKTEINRRYSKGAYNYVFLNWTFLHRFGYTGINVFHFVMLKL